MLYFTKTKEQCTGCSACFATCPTQCITMEKDEKGFLYPKADESKCIHCGKCERVCPIFHVNRNQQNISKQCAVAAVSKEYEVWKDSSSGGAFTEICKAFIGDENGIVFGAEFQFPKVKHIGVPIQEIRRLQRSKYVQSEVGSSFGNVKIALEQKMKVVFVGTPCQVAGLRAYLNKDYVNLICVDFICHGVGSPDVFNKCMQYEGKKEKSSVIDYKFRNKTSLLGNYQRYVSMLTYQDGHSRTIEMDAYNKFFLGQLCLRDCCGEQCKFRVRERNGDITIADFNNKERLLPEINDNRAFSSIIFNTEKGLSIQKSLEDRMNMWPVSMTAIMQYNPLFCRSTPSSPKRIDFFADFCSGVPIETLLEKYAPLQKKSLGYLKRFIPWQVKHEAYRMLIRMRKGNDAK